MRKAPSTAQLSSILRFARPRPPERLPPAACLAGREALGDEPCLAARPSASCLFEVVRRARAPLPGPAGSEPAPWRHPALGRSWGELGRLSVMYGLVRALCPAGRCEVRVSAGGLVEPKGRVAFGGNGELITVPDLVWPARYPSCFISYCSRDREFVIRLHEDLERAGVPCWVDRHDLRMGDRLRHAVDEAIRRHDRLLLVLSAASVRSRWVEKEVETAFEDEQHSGRDKLLPIRLDGAVWDARCGWVADVRRSRNIGDFVGWRDPARYRASLEKLLRDLKAG